MSLLQEPARALYSVRKGLSLGAPVVCLTKVKYGGYRVNFMALELKELLLYLKAWLVVENTMMRRATLCWVASPRSMGKKHQGQPHRGSDEHVTAVTASDEFPG